MKRDCQCPRARHEHGTRAMHDRCGCRCFPCRVAAAHARKVSRHGHRHSDAVIAYRAGTRRRVEALHAIGWTGAQIAERLGITFQAVHSMRTRSNATIAPALAERIATLYDELWDKPPTGPIADRTRRWARGKGWVPPMGYDDDAIDDVEMFIYKSQRDDDTGKHPAFIDEIAVERACLGDNVPLTRAELSAAIDTLGHMGYGADETARRLRISGRTVVRHRTKGAA